jgi:hydroxyacylglutathione hydrolase
MARRRLAGGNRRDRRSLNTELCHRGEEAMIFRPFYYYDLGCASYLLGCGTLGVCAVVDPRADDVDAYVAFARAKKMRVTQVIDTHVHADHRSGGVELARQTGAAYRLHESADVRVPFTPMRDGEEIELGNTRVRVLHTPGHSPESVSLLVTDLKRGTDPWFVLTGDTLFVGAVGRPDLPGRAGENAAQLYSSIHQTLLTLPDDLEIYPGHFSGSLCGAGLSGKPSSTIAFERRWNPMLSMDREAFMTALADVLAKPAEMERILASNRGVTQVESRA